MVIVEVGDVVGVRIRIVIELLFLGVGSIVDVIGMLIDVGLV